MRRSVTRFATGLVAAVALGCASLGSPSAPDPPALPSAREALARWLPAGFPPPAVPTANPVTAPKVELGARLFYDERLSASGRISCATCHRPELAFTDGRPVALGAHGAAHRRNTMSLVNVAYNASFTWADPNLRTLESQMLVPMFQREPVELGLEGRVPQVMQRLAADPELRTAFVRAFPGERPVVTLSQVIRSIATYERTLLSGNSPYDRLVYWGEEALSAAARRGMDLFFSERLGCGECHGGFNLSGPVVVEGGPHRRQGAQPEFHNTGLYDEDGAGGYPPRDRGLLELTERPEDDGRFRAPSLRNVALTAPYMHDGSIATLEAVVAHYAAGGRAHAGRDAESPPDRRSPRVSGFEISPGEMEDLIAFLESLTDEEFLARHSPPGPDAASEAH